MGDAPETSGFALDNSASHLLRRAQQLAEDRFAVLAKNNGLTLRQFAVLAAVAQTPGLSQSDLVRATSIDRSTLAEMVLRMEKRGLLVRATSSADARANSVRLSQAGAMTLAASIGHAKAADAAILDLLSAPKRKAFMGTLHRLAKRAEEVAAAEDKAHRKEARKQARAAARAREKADRAKERKLRALAEKRATGRGKVTQS